MKLNLEVGVNGDPKRPLLSREKTRLARDGIEIETTRKHGAFTSKTTKKIRPEKNDV